MISQRLLFLVQYCKYNRGQFMNNQQAHRHHKINFMIGMILYVLGVLLYISAFLSTRR